MEVWKANFFPTPNLQFSWDDPQESRSATPNGSINGKEYGLSRWEIARKLMRYHDRGKKVAALWFISKVGTGIHAY
ncbi:hypothetical protein CVT26_007302 [Gymnopilus dilepis]|uniref:Uncharacterized protein n=1 Tax=Gymnopilus dilepis TaxID=231916 RepID=A0A409VLT1_9AGAR|nr:hypothetical protein CVT26_007302 [Gymnopilus dilepis]